jgi:hypothetical protein
LDVEPTTTGADYRALAGEILDRVGLVAPALALVGGA